MEKLNGFITLRQAAQHTGYSPDYLSFLIRTGKLEGKKVGKSWLTTHEDVDQLIKFGSGQSVRSKKVWHQAKVLAILSVIAFLASVAVYGFSTTVYQEGYIRAQSITRHQASSTLDTEPIR